MNFIKQFDDFGQGLEVKFQQKSNYQTKLGGLIGLCILISVTGYCLTELVSMSTRSSPDIITSKTMIDLNSAPHVSLDKKGFSLMGTIFKIEGNE